MKSVLSKRRIRYIYFTILGYLLIYAPYVSADTAADRFKSSAEATARATGHLTASGGGKGIFSAKTLPEAIGVVISIILSILGVLFLGLIVYGGYLWMIDRGEQKEAQKARSIIINSVIGLFIVLAAYVITDFLITNVFKSI